MDKKQVGELIGNEIILINDKITANYEDIKHLEIYIEKLEFEIDELKEKIRNIENQL